MVLANNHYSGKYQGADHSICNLRYGGLEEIPTVFRKGSNCDYHFINKQVAEQFEYQFKCLGENTEKYFLGSNRKIRKRENYKIQNKIH